VILKLLLESSHAKIPDSPKVDVGPTLYLLASLISRFAGFDASRAKTKFCAICDIACDSEEPLVLRKDTNHRHLILDIILEWVQPTNVCESLAVRPEADQSTLQGDLNMACLRSAAKLLERLQLQPPENTSPEDDSVHVASRLFNRYSGALLHGLDTYYSDDIVSI
jgi:hypothetical protein